MSYFEGKLIGWGEGDMAIQPVGEEETGRESGCISASSGLCPNSLVALTSLVAMSLNSPCKPMSPALGMIY